MPSDYIETFTGVAFRPFSPCLDDIRIIDIAHSLAHQCRYLGHTRYHYSVAEHSVRVAKEIGRLGYSTHDQLWGLLHDASEAYLGDVPTPLKAMPAFREYRAAEARLMQAVCSKYRLSLSKPECVTNADLTLLATEARDLMPFKEEHWSQLAKRPLTQSIVPMSSTRAKETFLNFFANLEVSWQAESNTM